MRCCCLRICWGFRGGREEILREVKYGARRASTLGLVKNLRHGEYQVGTASGWPPLLAAVTPCGRQWQRSLASGTSHLLHFSSPRMDLFRALCAVCCLT